MNLILIFAIDSCDTTKIVINVLVNEENKLFLVHQIVLKHYILEEHVNIKMKLSILFIFCLSIVLVSAVSTCRFNSISRHLQCNNCTELLAYVHSKIDINMATIPGGLSI